MLTRPLVGPSAGRGDRRVGDHPEGSDPPQRHDAARSRRARTVRPDHREEHPPQAHAGHPGAGRPDRLILTQEGTDPRPAAPASYPVSVVILLISHVVV